MIIIDSSDQMNSELSPQTDECEGVVLHLGGVESSGYLQGADERRPLERSRGFLNFLHAHTRMSLHLTAALPFGP